MKSVISIILIVLGLSSFIMPFSDGTKIKYNKKTGEVSKGDVVQFYMEGIKGSAYVYSVKNLDRKELMYITLKDAQSATNANLSPGMALTNNMPGYYYRVLFFNNKTTAEFSFVTSGRLAETILENNLIANNAVDTIAQNRFILINGNEFSKRVENQNNDQIIINKNQNNQPYPSRNGIKISIGN